MGIKRQEIFIALAFVIVAYGIYRYL
jgi:hypothetical protein